MLRFLTAGESHGPALTAILEGMPAGVPIDRAYIENELRRRWLGYGRGPRQRIETDVLSILGGVRFGETLGSPISLKIDNAEWEAKWSKEMSPDAGATEKPLVEPRPGHADLAGMQKYDRNDARDILERASARETAARVAVGACIKQLLAQFDISIVSHVVAVGKAHIAEEYDIANLDLNQIDASEMRCIDADAEQQMINEVKAAAKEGDSLGGCIEVVASNVPVGLGSHVQWDRRLDARLSQALMSIQAVKAVELGEGVALSQERGSVAHDPIYFEDGAFTRHTTRAGGVEGGISMGGYVRARAYMKPLSTLNRPVIETINVETKQSTVSFKERTDVMAVPALGVIAESMMAFVIADELLRKFGGDSLTELQRNVASYVKNLDQQFGTNS